MIIYENNIERTKNSMLDVHLSLVFLNSWLKSNIHETHKESTGKKIKPAIQHTSRKGQEATNRHAGVSSGIRYFEINRFRLTKRML